MTQPEQPPQWVAAEPMQNVPADAVWLNPRVVPPHGPVVFMIVRAVTLGNVKLLFLADDAVDVATRMLDAGRQAKTGLIVPRGMVIPPPNPDGQHG